MENKFMCPVCKGSGRKPLPEEHRRYAKVLAGYDPGTDTLGCDNCGAQYMFSTATGWVGANRDGEPCVHDYTDSGEKVGRCATRYTCKHCGDSHIIDSGD